MVKQNIFYNKLSIFLSIFLYSIYAYMQVYLFSSVFQKVNRVLYNYEGVSTYFCSFILKFLLLINKFEFCVKSIFLYHLDCHAGCIYILF